MNNAIVSVCVLVFSLQPAVFGQTNLAAFFRISSAPGSFNASITEIDPLAGTITISNDVAGITNQLQRVYSLQETNVWVDFVQLVSTSTVTVGSVIDLHPPEDMVYVPEGVFQMGDSNSDGDYYEHPVHSVYVSGFYIGKCEVSKTQWDTTYNWASTNDYAFDGPGTGKDTNHPVVEVSWYDCAKWCNARSEMEGRTPCYYTDDESVYRDGQQTITCDWGANGYRLPTEAEWEKAARGGLNGKRFAFGDTIQHAVANYYSDAVYPYDTSETRGYHPLYNYGEWPLTSPVGSFEPNGYGLYDTVGNVWEWCWDYFSTGYYSLSPASNPRGPDSGYYRVAHGGAWHLKAAGARTAFRDGGEPTLATESLGFRVCFNAR